ncbi:MAG: LolA family protein [Myxococcota bacterium]
MRGALLTLLLALTACPPKHPEPVVVTDPLALLARAEAEMPSTPRASTFSVRIDTPDQHVSANGTLVVAPPDRFRLEVRPPIGPPALIVASDGTSLWAWQAGKQIFWEAPDADAVFGERGLGMETLAALLLGRLPTGLGEPVLADVGYVWTREGVEVRAKLDPATAELAWFEARDADGTVWAAMSANVPELVREYRIPSLGAEVRIDLDAWGEAKPDPSVFTLTPPEGAERKRLRVGPGVGAVVHQPRAW